jgi:hypothetical protein
MSVIVIAKVQGDTAKFRQSLTDRGDEYAKIVDSAKAAGAIHHRFGIGDGFVLIQDEWDTAEHFQRFFSDPSLLEFMSTVGAAPAPPEIIIAEAVSSSDQF